jgi:hypothetical protein
MKAKKKTTAKVKPAMKWQIGEYSRSMKFKTKSGSYAKNGARIITQSDHTNHWRTCRQQLMQSYGKKVQNMHSA